MKLDELINTLSTKYEIVVGFPKDKQITYPPSDIKGRPEPGGPTPAQVARMNEFGAKNVWWQSLNGGKGGFINIPARPFIRNAFRDNKDKIDKMLKFAYRFENIHNLEKNLEKIGLKIKYMIKDSIRNGNWQKNSPRTIAIKELTRARRNKAAVKPLIDRGIMLNNVFYEVRKV